MITLSLSSINVYATSKMDWLKIRSQENQDMQSEFIGNLILHDGFKVQYSHVELYSESLRILFKKTFNKHGYTISIIYRNDFTICEITAIKKTHRYLDYAIILAVFWTVYRIWSNVFF